MRFDVKSKATAVQTGSVGPIARYFLRCLATVRRTRKNADTSSQLFDAILEVSSVTLGAPILGVILFLGIATLDVWAPTVGAAVGPIGFLWLMIGALIYSAFVAVAGHLWLKPKLLKYAEDPTLCDRYDNRNERRIALVQKFTVLLFFSVVPPFLGLIVLVGPSTILEYF